MSYNTIVDITTTEIAYVNGPVTVEEAQAFCRVQNTNTQQDLQFAMWVLAARDKIEQYCGLSLIPKNIVAILEAKQGMMELPFGPVTSTPTFVDQQGVSQEITLIGLDYPVIQLPIAYTKATYEAGFAEGECPLLLKQAILMQVCYWWENRGDQFVQGYAPGVIAICQKFKRGF